jgi:acetoin utilization deacetylase AcuC-like enzyme
MRVAIAFRRTAVLCYCGVSGCHAWNPAMNCMSTFGRCIRQHSHHDQTAATRITWVKPVSMRYRRTAPSHRHDLFMSFSSAVEKSTAADADREETADATSRVPKFRVYYNDVYEVPLPPRHRFPMKKYRMVRERIQQQIQARQQTQQKPTIHNNNIDFVVSPLATVEELATTHDPDYIQRFLSGNQTQTEQRNVGFPWSPQGVDRALSSVGGTLAAACYVCKHQQRQQQRNATQQQPSTAKPAWAAHVAGGTHHAFYDCGEGFSVFSDMAVAANVVLQRYPTVVSNNILLVDLDVHQGNGNAVLFQGNPKVFTFSVHCSGNYFSEKQRSDLDLELPIGCNDSTYLMTLHHWLKEFRRRHDRGEFVIDLVFFQAGVDILEADRLGRMNLTPEGVRRRNELVYQFVHDIQAPLVICMGGGYPKRLSAEDEDDGWPEIIDAHANVYLQAYEFLEKIGK